MFGIGDVKMSMSLEPVMQMPLKSLTKDQFAQNTTIKVEQLNFYQPSMIEMITEKGEKKYTLLHATNLAKFYDNKSFASYLENVHWLVTQISASDDYSLQANVRGVGGGNGSSSTKDNGPLAKLTSAERKALQVEVPNILEHVEQWEYDDRASRGMKCTYEYFINKAQGGIEKGISHTFCLAALERNTRE